MARRNCGLAAVGQRYNFGFRRRLVHSSQRITGTSLMRSCFAAADDLHHFAFAAMLLHIRSTAVSFL